MNLKELIDAYIGGRIYIRFDESEDYSCVETDCRLLKPYLNHYVRTIEVKNSLLLITMEAEDET